MKTLAFYNNKGGVGKTTAAINVAYTLASQGSSVLVIDCDGQQNSARFFADDAVAGNGQLLNVLIGSMSPTTARRKTRYRNIGILVGTSELNDVPTLFAALPEGIRQRNIKSLISEWELNSTGNYDYIIFDCPPALNIFTESILRIVDGVVVPIEIGSFAIQGVATVTNTIIKSGGTFLGCFASMLDRYNNAELQMLEMLRNNLGGKMFDTVIPRSNIIKNSLSCRMSADEYMGWMNPAQAYVKLTNEIKERIEKIG